MALNLRKAPFALSARASEQFSPLAVYDTASDAFLVLDVNPASAGWVWMPTATLINGMRTFDRVENRGYIHVESRNQERSHPFAKPHASYLWDDMQGYY
jgi:hypothetical protein